MTDWKAFHEAERRNQLAALRFHFGEAYAISYGGGKWYARRLDTGELLTALYPDDLERFMIADHWHRPVPRDLEVIPSLVFW